MMPLTFSAGLHKQPLFGSVYARLVSTPKSETVEKTNAAAARSATSSSTSWLTSVVSKAWVLLYSNLFLAFSPHRTRSLLLGSSATTEDGSTARATHDGDAPVERSLPAVPAAETMTTMTTTTTINAHEFTSAQQDSARPELLKSNSDTTFNTTGMDSEEDDGSFHQDNHITTRETSRSAVAKRSSTTTSGEQIFDATHVLGMILLMVLALYSMATPEHIDHMKHAVRQIVNETEAGWAYLHALVTQEGTEDGMVEEGQHATALKLTWAGVSPLAVYP